MVIILKEWLDWKKEGDEEKVACVGGFLPWVNYCCVGFQFCLERMSYRCPKRAC